MTEEYKSLSLVATSRTKIVLRQGTNQGVDAFDAAQMLEKVMKELKQVQPSTMLENIWSSGSKQMRESKSTTVR